ncbi:hypothetical protein F5Y03DRAFT_371285 [Xylaria venustula]|nr:hypothetical protein F5Y03DRAFT_371285 [Xylaria venustula]
MVTCRIDIVSSTCQLPAQIHVGTLRGGVPAAATNGIYLYIPIYVHITDYIVYYYVNCSVGVGLVCVLG